MNGYWQLFGCSSLEAFSDNFSLFQLKRIKGVTKKVAHGKKKSCQFCCQYPLINYLLSGRHFRCYNLKTVNLPVDCIRIKIVISSRKGLKADGLFNWWKAESFWFTSPGVSEGGLKDFSRAFISPYIVKFLLLFWSN